MREERLIISLAFLIIHRDIIVNVNDIITRSGKKKNKEKKMLSYKCLNNYNINYDTS